MVRDARPEDVDGLVALYGQLLRVAPPRHVVESLVDGALDDPFSRVLVVDVDGRLVATAHAVSYASPLRVGGRKGVLDAVVVNDADRGQGYATQVASAALDWLHEADSGPVLIATRADRKAAHELYRALGCASWGLTFASERSVPYAG